MTVIPEIQYQSLILIQLQVSRLSVYKTTPVCSDEKTPPEQTLLLCTRARCVRTFWPIRLLLPNLRIINLSSFAFLFRKRRRSVVICLRSYRSPAHSCSCVLPLPHDSQYPRYQGDEQRTKVMEKVTLCTYQRIKTASCWYYYCGSGASGYPLPHCKHSTLTLYYRVWSGTSSVSLNTLHNLLTGHDPFSMETVWELESVARLRPYWSERLVWKDRSQSQS